MEASTVKQLRVIAKERGIRRYSALRKPELIAVINAHSATDNHNLLDDPVPDISAPVLTPTKYVAPPQKEVKTGVLSTIKSYADWLISYVPEQIKKPINKAVEALKAKVAGLFGKANEHKFVLYESQTAIKGFTKRHTVDGRPGIDVVSFLSAVRPLVVDLLERNRRIKVSLVLTCTMERVDMKTGELTTINAPFVSRTEVCLEATDVSELYNNAMHKMKESMASFQMRGSNWRFVAVQRLDINTVDYKPLKGSSYIPLPRCLADKKAIINLKNDDDQCFKWCVARALNIVDDNPHRITKTLKAQAETLNWNDVTFPTTLSEIDKFERNNTDLSVNVFGYEDFVYPLRISKHDRKDAVDLLLISNDTTNHYCLIKNLSKLLSTQVSNKKDSRLYCRRCLNSFISKEALDKHKRYCNQHAVVRPEMPEPGSVLTFKNHNRSMRVPFVVYADFESFIKPIDTCQPDPSKSYTKQYQKHIPSSFCYYIKCFEDDLYSQEPVAFTADSEDDDIAQIFVNKLEDSVKQIYKQFFKFPNKMVFTETDKIKYNDATTCHICDGELGDDRVRDHCHFTGRFRGAAHNGCNLNYKAPKFIPVIFHNLSGYDSHLFIKKLARNGEKIKCIPNNEEKYISFSKEVVVDEFSNKEGKHVQVKRELRFLDSFRFMASSIDALSKNLSKEQCKNVKSRYFGKQLDLVLRKGVYPYEYMDSLERLNETQLPSKTAFYSKLNETEISDEDYKHAQTVWKEFGCKTIRDYHNLYNVSDVLLLADIFENFRDVCMDNYKLDPAWYFTSPGLAWDAALKLTGVELELLSDYDMTLMIKHGIRGGISTISNRYGVANNKYMGEAYDSSKPSSFITYLDANNLYGWAMSKHLPTHGFEWMSDDELNNWRGMPCILEVDLEYPEELHDVHNDYPLAPESLKVGVVNKLIPNLDDKHHYVVHYENLKLYESLGLKVSRVHRGIKFKESDWLKQYIDLNTSLRTKASNDFVKDFYKLMNNSVFGKTMENIENRVDVRLVTNERDAIKLASKPNYDSRTIFDENLIAVHMKRTKLVYNKPIYLGMCILDLSKTLMYDFHYNYINDKYGDRAKLLFTDTDSLCYEIKTDDFYVDIADDIESRFDTSDYPKDHPSGVKSGVNKKVIGMFKDEAGGKQIEEFVGLRAKLYSYKISGEEDHKKCKGVKKAVVRKSITHDDYKKCLFTRQEQLRKMNVIRSHLHAVYTEEVNKVALSADDDKRVILADGISTLAYGHWRVKHI